MARLFRIAVAALIGADGVAMGALYGRGSIPSSPTRMRTAAPIADLASVERKRDGLFHIDGTAGAARVDFVIDTGANVTVMSAAEARRLGGAALWAHDGAVMQTAGGRSPMTWWHVPDLSIAGRRVGAVEVAVIDRAPAWALLGQDLLARLGTLTIADGRLTIGAAGHGAAVPRPDGQ